MSSGDGGRVTLAACGGTLRAGSEIALGWPDEEKVWSDLCFDVGPGDTAEVAGLGTGQLVTGRLGGDRLSRDGVEVIREVFEPDSQLQAMACRLRLINHSTTDLRVSRLSPLSMSGDGLDLAGTPAGDWVYLRAPRKKNDMPACVRLGDEGPGIWDAARGTPETGGLPQGAGGDLPRRYVSSELTAITGRDVSVALGFLPVDRQLVQSLLTLTPDRRRLESLRLDCLCDGQKIAAGSELVSQWVVARFATDRETAIAAYTESLRQAQPRRPSDAVYPAPPTVWCSWYYYGNGFTQKECEENLEALTRRPLPIDVFQVDEAWDLHWGDWGPNGDWPDLEGVATHARELGMAPGIWVCPVLAEPRSRIHHAHRDWLVRDRHGTPITFSMGGMSNFVLDPTVPAAHAYIREIFRRLRRDLGYTYFKLDFMRAVGEPGAVFADPAINRAQAFRLALEAVRDGAGDDAYVNVCGGFYGPALGLADAQRSGSDVKSLWPAPPTGEESAGYGPFAIKQNSLRYWMNDLWHNDPDALMVRRRREPARDEPLSVGLLNEDEALTCTLNQYLGGGIVCFTENLAEIDDDRLFLLRHCAPSLDAAAVPRDILEAPRFPAVFDTTVTPRAAGQEPWHTVSLVNWFEEPRTFQLALDNRLLGPFADGAGSYLIGAFTGGWHRTAATGETIEVGPVPPHGCEVIKIQIHRPDLPQLVRTDGHFSMGGTEISAWEPAPEGLEIGVDWPWPNPLQLWVRPPQGRAFEDWGRDEVAEIALGGNTGGTRRYLRYE